MKQKKQQLGDIVKNYTEPQLRELIHKLQARDASQRLDISKLKEQIVEVTCKYHKALKQIGEMEKIQKRDTEYIKRIDGFLMEAKKRFDENKKQQTDQYVDALLEITKQRDEYLKQNIQLEIQINDLNEQIENFKRQNTIIPSASQQQFSAPLSITEEVHDNRFNYRKKSSLHSVNTQDSVMNDDDDQLMSFLQQLDEQQANQLYSIFSSINKNNDDIVKRMLNDEPSLQNSFSFSHKYEDKENQHF